MNQIITALRPYRLLAKRWRAYALAFRAVPPRITAPLEADPPSRAKRAFQINWGFVLCVICFLPIGYLIFHRPAPLHPEISTRHITPNHYFCPTVGSVHELEVPGAGWMLTTFLGNVADTNDLPTNARIGDLYYCPRANGSYWVWSVLHGQTIPSWVDP